MVSAFPSKMLSGRGPIKLPQPRSRLRFISLSPIPKELVSVFHLPHIILTEFKELPWVAVLFTLSLYIISNSGFLLHFPRLKHNSASFPHRHSL